MAPKRGRARKVNGGDSTTKHTRAGRGSSVRTATVNVVASLERAEHAAWLVCYSAALGGAMSAHRAEPDAQTIVQKAAALADLSMKEAKARRYFGDHHAVVIKR